MSSINCITFYPNEEQHGAVGPWIQFPIAKNLFPSTACSITTSDLYVVAVDDKSLVVSSNQSNAWLFVQPVMDIMREVLNTEWSTRLKVNFCDLNMLVYDIVQ